MPSSCRPRLGDKCVESRVELRSGRAAPTAGLDCGQTHLVHDEATPRDAASCFVNPLTALDMAVTKRVVDCGVAVNPDSVRAQREGGIAWASSAVSRGEISLEGGRVRQGNFHDYPIVTLAQMPPIGVVVMEGADRAGGVGKEAGAPFAPALANAIFRERAQGPATTAFRRRSAPGVKHDHRFAGAALGRPLWALRSGPACGNHHAEAGDLALRLGGKLAREVPRPWASCRQPRA